MSASSIDARSTATAERHSRAAQGIVVDTSAGRVAFDASDVDMQDSVDPSTAPTWAAASSPDKDIPMTETLPITDSVPLKDSPSIIRSSSFAAAGNAIHLMTKAKNAFQEAVKQSPTKLSPVVTREAPCCRCNTVTRLDREKRCHACAEEAGRCPICSDVSPELDDPELSRALLCRVCKTSRPKPNPSTRARRNRTKKNILALEGGGLRGVFTLTILKKIEEISGQRITDMFDLIVGCSAGGVIALGMHLDRSIDEGISLFTDLATEAFVLAASSTSQTTAKAVKATTGVGLPQSTANKYKHQPLDRLLKRNLTHDLDLKRQDQEPKVAVVSVQWDLDPKRPVLMRSYNKPEDSGMEQGAENPKIWEAARATSAAPTYFRPAYVEDHWYVDGGLVANDPSLVALAEASALYDGMDNINMLLSIGSGCRTALPVEVNPNPWLWKLANDVVKACIHHDVNEVALKAILGDRFMRLDASIVNTGMDDPALMTEWIEAATKYVEDPATIESLQVLIAHLLSADE